jgi:hypothetical protein
VLRWRGSLAPQSLCQIGKPLNADPLGGAPLAAEGAVPEITLIDEVNVHERPSAFVDRVQYSLSRFLHELRIRDTASSFVRYSVWLCPGQLTDNHDYRTHATRILGPTSEQVANEFISNLTSVLESSGLTVHRKAAADD